MNQRQQPKVDGKEVVVVEADEGVMMVAVGKREAHPDVEEGQS